jgi:DNA ligase-associated metallophosphoesterase
VSAGLAIRIGDVEAVCRPSGALWIESARALIVADLHFEKASAYAARGQMLPPYDTRETLARLEAETKATQPSLLVFLGDSFHDRSAESRLPQDEAHRIAALAVERRLVWIVGNHDEEGPRRVPGESLPRLDLAGLRLVHEPRPGVAPGEVAGHLHPCAKVRGPGGTVRRRCFVTDGERLVLPAFGALAGGLNVRDEAFLPLFNRRPLAGVLGRGRVHPVAWASLSDD